MNGAAAYHGTPAPVLDFVHEQLDCIRIRAEIGTRYAEVGDAAGLAYTMRGIMASMRAIAPCVVSLQPSADPDEARQ